MCMVIVELHQILCALRRRLPEILWSVCAMVILVSKPLNKYNLVTAYDFVYNYCMYWVHLCSSNYSTTKYVCRYIVSLQKAEKINQSEQVKPSVFLYVNVSFQTHSSNVEA